MSTETSTLLTPDMLPFTTGVAPYFDSSEPGKLGREPRIYLRIELGTTGIELLAMVDTGAPWCILEPRLVDMAAGHFEELPKTAVISTRLGRFEGKLYLGTARIVAQEGDTLDVEATFFVSPKWPAGNFVGYVGFMDRYRSALDPNESRFYFGPFG